MRRLFLPCCVLSGLCVVCLGLSLFRFSWVSPSAADRIVLDRGSLGVWVGGRGDWVAFRPPYGLAIQGWSGASCWTPAFDTDARMHVQSGPVLVPGPVPSKVIRGVSVLIPWYLPILLLAAGGGMSFPAWRRQRRGGAGLCEACGYDLTGLRERCPECGGLIKRALAMLRVGLARIIAA